MRRKDWMLFIAASALFGLGLLGCDTTIAPKQAGHVQPTSSRAVATTQSTTDADSSDDSAGGATELAANMKAVVLDVPGMT